MLVACGWSGSWQIHHSHGLTFLTFQQMAVRVERHSDIRVPHHGWIPSGILPAMRAMRRRYASRHVEVETPSIVVLGQQEVGLQSLGVLIWIVLYLGQPCFPSRRQVFA